MMSMIDPNNLLTNYSYNDPLERLTQVQRAVGTPYENWMTVSYPSLTQMIIAQDKNKRADGLIQTTSIYDGLERIIHKIDSVGNTVDTTYNAVGEVQSVSNPHGNLPAPTDGTTWYKYDALGRKTIEQDQDNSIQQWCYSGQQTTGQNNCSTVSMYSLDALWTDYSDATGRHRQQVTDGLGRLAAVIEPNAQSGAITAVTAYSYDTLNNLLSVNQRGNSGDVPRLRSFSYDSLSRLLSANNPETGTVNYTYDNNGNVLTKTDARGITIAYSYDALNRLLSKSYSDGATALSCYQYDSSSVSFGIGRLTNAWTQSASGPSCSPALAPVPPVSGFLTKRSILAYDAMGRILNEQQYTPATSTNGAPYSPIYTYDLAGNLLTSTTGVGPASTPITFTNSFDSAGHLLTLSSNWTNNSVFPQTLFSNPTYAPHGGLTGANFGTGLTLSRAYDNRLRAISETDKGTGATAATPGSAAVTITGAEQSQ
jgi:YD repeat-containing protein